MYNVDISPAANSVLEEYTFRCAIDNGEECALRLLDAYDEKISYWKPRLLWAVEDYAMYLPNIGF